MSKIVKYLTVICFEIIVKENLNYNNKNTFKSNYSSNKIQFP